MLLLGWLTPGCCCHGPAGWRFQTPHGAGAHGPLPLRHVLQAPGCAVVVPRHLHRCRYAPGCCRWRCLLLRIPRCRWASQLYRRCCLPVRCAADVMTAAPPACHSQSDPPQVMPASAVAASAVVRDAVAAAAVGALHARSCHRWLPLASSWAASCRCCAASCGALPGRCGSCGAAPQTQRRRGSARIAAGGHGGGWQHVAVGRGGTRARLGAWLNGGGKGGNRSGLQTGIGQCTARLHPQSARLRRAAEARTWQKRARPAASWTAASMECRLHTRYLRQRQRSLLGMAGCPGQLWLPRCAGVCCPTSILPPGKYHHLSLRQAGGLVGCSCGCHARDKAKQLRHCGRAWVPQSEELLADMPAPPPHLL